MYNISVTPAVFHVLTAWLNAEAEENMDCIVKTPSVLHLPMA